MYNFSSILCVIVAAFFINDGHDRIFTPVLVCMIFLLVECFILNV